MWSPWMAHHFHLQRNDMVAQSIRLAEIVAMWDATKEK